MLLHRLSSLIFLLLAVFPGILYAQDTFSVSPPVLDLKLHPGEEANFDLKFKNLAGRRFVNIYVFVRDVVGGQDSGNRSSLSSWIEIPRYIELKPGEDGVVKLRVLVNRLASTGRYGSEIIFVEAMDEAGAKRMIDSANKMEVNVEVYNDRRERLQINRFLPEKDIYFSFPATLFYEIENVGDTDIYSRAKVLFYDKKGSLVEEKSIVEGGFLLKPKEKKASEIITSQVMGRGKFDAVLMVDYDQQSLVESTSFVVFDWQRIGLIFIATITLLLIMVNFSYKIYEKSF